VKIYFPKNQQNLVKLADNLLIKHNGISVALAGLDQVRKCPSAPAPAAPPALVSVAEQLDSMFWMGWAL